MTNDQIVSALLSAARAAVTATLGERAEVVWPLLEGEARAAAEESARELVALLEAPNDAKRQRRERVRKAYEAFAPISQGTFLPANFPLEVEPSADKPAWFPIVLNSLLPPFVLADFVGESREEARNQILRTPVNQRDYDEWARLVGEVNEYESPIVGLVGKWGDEKKPYLLQNAMFLLHSFSGEVAKRLDQLRNTAPVKIADDLKAARRSPWSAAAEIDRMALRIFLSEKLGREVQETYPSLQEAAVEYERKSADVPSPWARRVADAKRRAEAVNEKVRSLREKAPMAAYDLEELETPSPYLTKDEMDEYEERLKAAEGVLRQSPSAPAQAEATRTGKWWA